MWWRKGGTKGFWLGGRGQKGDETPTVISRLWWQNLGTMIGQGKISSFFKPTSQKRPLSTEKEVSF